MIIDLPPVLGYDAISEILSEDLFLPALDDDEEYDMDGVAHKRNGVIGMRGNLGVNMGRTECSRVDESGKVNAMDSGMLSDAELVYSSTSASESELESYIDSGLESDAADLFSAPAPELQTRSHAVMSFSEEYEREIALHSPGKLLNTPRDPSRRYEYPFPTGSISTPSDSPASTPAVTPLIMGVPSPASSSMSLNSINLILAPAEVPVPRVAPIPIPVSPHNQAGPSKQAALSPPSVPHAHPKLLKFRPGDIPVPPSLRGRSIVFDGSSMPHAIRSLPTTPSKAVTNPLEEKRSRSQEPEPGPSLLGGGNMPPFRRAVTNPAIPLVGPQATYARTHHIPPTFVPPESSPELDYSGAYFSSDYPPDSPTLTASPALTIVDMFMDCDIEPLTDVSTTLLSESPSLAFSPPPPTDMDLHATHPDPDIAGYDEDSELDPDDVFYDAYDEEMFELSS